MAKTPWIFVDGAWQEVGTDKTIHGLVGDDWLEFLPTGTGPKAIWGYVNGVWTQLLRSKPLVSALVGPALYSTAVSTTYYTGGPGTTIIWQPTMHDGSGEVYVGGRNILFHRASPVWNWTFDRILYQELSVTAGGFPAIDRKLCLMDPDGGNRVVVHDSGDDTLSRYYHSYSVSPDGLKVAIYSNHDWGTNKIRVYAADGSGLLGAMSTFEFATPNWSLDSEYVYFSDGSSGSICRRKYDASDSKVAIRSAYDIDYFWQNFAGGEFSSQCFSTTPDGVIVIDLGNTTIVQYTENDFPWTGPVAPIGCFWSEDDTRLIVDRQNHSFFNGTSNAVMFNKDDPSDYAEYGPGSSAVTGTEDANPPFAECHPEVNWSLVKINGVTKIACPMRQGFDLANEDRNNGIGLVAYDLETGVGEWLAYGINDAADGSPYGRISVTGTPIGTWYFGAQVYFNP